MEHSRQFNAVMYELDADLPSPRSGAFYVDGPGGSGKTFLYEAIVHQVHARGHIAPACAMSGIAATLLPGGTTAHSLFGLPLEMPQFEALSSIKAQEGRAEVLRRAKVIVWDESSMIPVAALDCVDRLLRDLMADNRPFGGKIVLLGGDFQQILPRGP